MIRFVVQKCTGLDKIMTALFWKQKLTMWEEFPDEMKRLHRCVGMDTQGGTRRSKMATGDLSWTWERAAATDRVQEPPTGSRGHRLGPGATDRVQRPPTGSSSQPLAPSSRALQRCCLRKWLMDYPFWLLLKDTLP